MKPSYAKMEIVGVDADKINATHDAMSAWLLRAVDVPTVAERLLAASHPGMKGHGFTFRSIELEPLIEHEDYVAGIADALIKFSDGYTRLWVEIKTDDREIGALVRQVKMYKRLIAGDSANWLALMPYASVGAREFLAHAGIGIHCPPMPLEQDLISLSVREEEYQRLLKENPFAAIPDATA